jgi:hypothetical protein
MPLAKPIRADRRKRHAANARDRVVKLKGDIFHSTAILCEFLYYAFNTILGLREVYPKQDFKWDKRYDIFLPMLIDPDLKGYLLKITTQLKRASVHSRSQPPFLSYLSIELPILRSQTENARLDADSNAFKILDWMYI